jgi:beta-phosphoglucomutase-like phosphatase (HAD superfamily)
MIDYTSRAFIFDMDGTLVDNMRFHGEAWQKMLAENGIETDAHNFLVNTAGKIVWFLKMPLTVLKRHIARE